MFSDYDPQKSSLSKDWRMMVDENSRQAGIHKLYILLYYIPNVPKKLVP